jgi:nucleotide-binding universal stress UspA family protein
MIPFRRILFPVDFSEPCRRIAPYARAVSAHFNAELTLVHAFELPPYYSGEMGVGAPLTQPISADDVRAALEKRIDYFAADLFSGKDLRTVVREGNAALVIQEMVQREGFDLVMMPTRGHGAFRRALLGSVTAKVLHDVSCAVWTSAHADDEEHQPELEPESILCAVDVDEEAVAVLKAAEVLAKSYGATLTVMHSVLIPADVYDLELGARGQELMERARLRLAQLRQEIAPSAEVIVAKGPVAKQVQKEALAMKADLVVTGRGHAQSALPAIRSGLPAIIRESACPVLSI